METATLDILQVSPISSTSQTSQALKRQRLKATCCKQQESGHPWGGHGVTTAFR